MSKSAYSNAEAGAHPGVEIPDLLVGLEVGLFVSHGRRQRLHEVEHRVGAHGLRFVN